MGTDKSADAGVGVASEGASLQSSKNELEKKSKKNFWSVSQDELRTMVIWLAMATLGLLVFAGFSAMGALPDASVDPLKFKFMLGFMIGGLLGAYGLVVVLVLKVL